MKVQAKPTLSIWLSWCWAPKPKRHCSPRGIKETKVESETEPVDRLPTSLEELKASKGGFVAYNFITGQDKDAIAKDLAAAFKLTEPQAAKIVRRITGRVRLYARVFELVSAKM